MAVILDAEHIQAIEKDLQSKLKDGFVADLVEVKESELKQPKSIEPFNQLPIKLYKSATVTHVLSKLLEHIVPGTPASYNQILSAVMQQKHTASFCYLIGGQVRDILKGKVSKDVDFNYACTARDVAFVCVENYWAVKFKAIGPVEKPNYVLIGDEQTDLYMEGFSTSFNATSECFKQDFRQNMLFYDIANHVIIDKSGYGVADILNHELRLACAPLKNYEEWASADMTLGQKALRYVKFVVRSQVQGKPLKTDEEESAFIATLLRRALQTNVESLKGFWFGYVLGECLSKQEGVQELYKWVCRQSGPLWWEDWLPLVRSNVPDPRWLDSFITSDSAESAASLIKSIFDSFDLAGDGLIQEDDLERVLRKLNINFTEKDFQLLFMGARPTNQQGKLRYKDFINHLMGLPSP